MGKAGPPKTPTAVLKARGSWRAKAGREFEPDYVPTVPEKPDDMGTIASIKWAEIAPELGRMRVLSKNDREALANYCRTFERMMELSGEINEAKTAGAKIMDLITNVRVEMALRDQCLKYLVQLGMTPAARSNVKVPKDTGTNDNGKGTDYIRIG